LNPRPKIYICNIPKDFYPDGRTLSALDWFITPGELSVKKIDGAPAVVFGTNPATGNFFVGTKVSSTK
jgi:hypothetical protein